MVSAAADEKREQKGGPLWFRRERRQGAPDAELKAALASADNEVAAGTLDDAVVGYGLVRVERLGDDVTPCRITEREKQPVAPFLTLQSSYNHLVVGYASRRRCQANSARAVRRGGVPGDVALGSATDCHA